MSLRQPGAESWWATIRKVELRQILPGETIIQKLLICKHVHILAISFTDLTWSRDAFAVDNTVSNILFIIMHTSSRIATSVWPKHRHWCSPVAIFVLCIRFRVSLVWRRLMGLWGMQSPLRLLAAPSLVRCSWAKLISATAFFITFRHFLCFKWVLAATNRVSDIDYYIDAGGVRARVWSLDIDLLPSAYAAHLRDPSDSLNVRWFLSLIRDSHQRSLVDGEALKAAFKAIEQYNGWQIIWNNQTPKYFEGLLTWNVVSFDANWLIKKARPNFRHNNAEVRINRLFVQRLQMTLITLLKNVVYYCRILKRLRVCHLVPVLWTSIFDVVKMIGYRDFDILVSKG